MEEKPKILIVDDKPENLVALESILNDFDVDFVRALSGNEALAKTLKHEFALGIIDVQMPEMDGYETVQLIHNDPDISYFPVIFVSAIHKEEFYVVKGIETGAVDFISKPIIPTILKGKVKVFLDLYEQRKLLQISNEELKSAKEEAERNSFLKSLFLATMSHEIRTPMNGIIGVTDMLKHTPLTEEQEDLVNIIYVSGNNLLTIINDILDFSKIEAGQLELESVRFNLRTIINEIIRLLDIKANEQQDELHADLDKHVPTFVIGDPLRLKQIIINLVNNAIKFTKKGKVTLKAEQISEEDKKIKLKFSVIDTGIGISEEGRKRLFKSFSQLSESTQRKFGGTGLGLAISKNLTQLMEGEIGVKSQEGKGSTFWFTAVFDKVDNRGEKEDQRSSAKKKQKSTDERKLKILLVEDNKINQKVALASLKPFGHDIKVAENGEEAIEKYKNGTFDVILMDIQMPVMDGYSATREIRKIEKTENRPHCKIVALTANARKEDQDESFKAGMDDFISKPFKRQDIERLFVDL
ncbi:MAG: response regulator [Bacteroidales bacterium]|nr:response regulator [Bacteroidales bacterium]MCF8349683.1 response regulator [Bacteroidales bacterium]MCF8374929.1 response regulator [Bacteroidales bacterium]MCF8400092.1 response regulator [Bacteroidales bacterium]